MHYAKVLIILLFSFMACSSSKNIEPATEPMPPSFDCRTVSADDAEHVFRCESLSYELGFFASTVDFPAVTLVFPDIVGMEEAMEIMENRIPLSENDSLAWKWFAPGPLQAVMEDYQLEISDTNWSTLADLPFRKKEQSEETLEIEEMREKELDIPKVLSGLMVSFISRSTYPQLTGPYKLRTGEMELSFTIRYPAQRLEELFIAESLSRVDTVMVDSVYASAIRILNDAFQLLPADTFATRAVQVMELWENRVIDGDANPYDLIASGESAFLAGTPDGWFNPFRITLLERYLESMVSTEETYEELLEGYKKLLLWSNQALRFQLALADLQAEHAYRNEAYWLAIDFMEEGMRLAPDDTRRVTEFRKHLREAVIRDHQADRHSNIHSYIRRHHSLFSSDFRIRYKYSVACHDQRDYTRWISELEWLLTNFDRNQTMVSTVEMLRSLNRAYQLGMRFDKAIDTNRRLYLRENDEEILQMFQINLRARMLQPIYRALPVFLSEYTRPGQIGSLQDRIVFYQRNYMDGLYVMNRQGEIIQRIYVSDDAQLSPPALQNQGAGEGSFLVDENLNKAWFVYPWNGFFAVLEWNTITTEAENLKLQAVRNNPAVPNEWEDFISHTELTGAVSAITVITAMIEHRPYQTYGRPLSAFASAVSSDHVVAYFLLYDNTPTLVAGDSSRFQSLVQREEWDSSLQRDVLFHQYLAEDPHDYLDVTKSIIQGGSNRGFVKMGFYSIR